MSVQIVFIILFVAVLIVSVICFAIVGLMQVSRTRRLSGQAHQLGMHFSASDPFDLPRRYADFALISNGHSPRANNVTHGTLSGKTVRAFDFRYEVGHGTRRMTRHYSIIVVETDRALPETVMWKQGDTESVPIGTPQDNPRIGSWMFCGDSETTASIARTLGDLPAEGAAVQTCGPAMMVFTRGFLRKPSYSVLLSAALSTVDALGASSQTRSEPTSEPDTEPEQSP